MPKITEEEMFNNLEFKCARCGAECVKNSKLEPELGYVSKVEGQFFGPICQDCFNLIPEEDKAVKHIPETAFVVLIRPDGGGVLITEEGVEEQFRRSPTPYDIKSACAEIVRKFSAVEAAQKTGEMLAVSASRSKLQLVR